MRKIAREELKTVYKNDIYDISNVPARMEEV